MEKSCVWRVDKEVYGKLPWRSTLVFRLLTLKNTGVAAVSLGPVVHGQSARLIVAA
jgi:hypothetical protein